MRISKEKSIIHKCMTTTTSTQIRICIRSQLRKLAGVARSISNRETSVIITIVRCLLRHQPVSKNS